MTFGAAFRRLMRVRNLTRKAMAYATFLAQRTVNITMTDCRLPEPKYLLRMAATLCLRADDIEAMAGRTTEVPFPASPRSEGWPDDLPRL
ncbi:hypothetical protein AB0H83_40395 [Dactylosporangium sp. NPDC050688]|uniref:hypothetical protein n=1 Tax=Dactylosporangium sp. NPDC050688 TaxID=3157217 RepID=UPI0033E209E8